MYAARVARPKLSLSISAVTSTPSRPVLSLKTPVAMTVPRTPISPSPLSPTDRNTKLNQRGFSTIQQPTFAYANTSSSKSILKKSGSPSGSAGKRIQFIGEPTVYCVTPIENPDDYYGSYVKIPRDERRWTERH